MEGVLWARLAYERDEAGDSSIDGRRCGGPAGAGLPLVVIGSIPVQDPTDLRPPFLMLRVLESVPRYVVENAVLSYDSRKKYNISCRANSPHRPEP